MARNLSLSSLSLLLLPLALGGCSDTRDMLGLGRTMPDEFVVVDRAPLVVPPDFTLRPPQPGAERPQEAAPSAKAEAIALGEKSATSAAVSPLEQQMLATAGADKTTADIRKTVDRESAEGVGASRHLVDDLLWWRKPGTEANVVDATAEAERLRQNQANGKAANAGATPTIEKRKSGWLGL